MQNSESRPSITDMPWGSDKSFSKHNVPTHVRYHAGSLRFTNLPLIQMRKCNTMLAMPQTIMSSVQWGPTWGSEGSCPHRGSGSGLPPEEDPQVQPGKSGGKNDGGKDWRLCPAYLQVLALCSACPGPWGQLGAQGAKLRETPLWAPARTGWAQKRRPLSLLPGLPAKL